MKQLSMTDYHSSDRVMRNRRESTSSGTKFIKLQNGKNLVKITNFCLPSLTLGIILEYPLV